MLEEEGWARLVALDVGRFALLDGVLAGHGLVRDADLGTVERDADGVPSLASWSGENGAEVDFRREQRMAWLEVRGEGDVLLASELAAALGGRPLGTLEELLAGLVRPSLGRGRNKSGEARWDILRAALATFVPENALVVRALIRSGLADPDWRVRMAAMLAVGRLRLADLAPLALAAEVPKPERDRIRQDERRALLALRQAAHDLAMGIEPQPGPGARRDADVIALRLRHQIALQKLLATGAPSGDSVANAMTTTLLHG